MRLIFQPPPRAIDRWPGGFGPIELTDLALAAEAAGFEAISLTDHPFPSDAWLGSGGHHSLEPFAALAFVAARTSRIRLLTNLIVAGYRNPYLAAKAAATVDTLSQGRLVLGMGAGYLKAEFSVLGAEYRARGGAFDATIDAMRAAWTGVSVRRAGAFPADGHTALPAPVQPGGPPVWIGGNSAAARRRVARLGDGWMPFQQPAELASLTGTDSLNTLDELAALIDEVRAMRRDHGRDDVVEIAYAPQRIGTAGALLEYLDEHGAAAQRAGATSLIWNSSARSLSACLTELETVGAALGH